MRKEKKEIKTKLQNEIKNNSYKNKELKKQLKEQKLELLNKNKENELTRIAKEKSNR